MKFTETSTEDSYIETQKKKEENEVINEMTEMIKESDFSLSIKKSLEIDQIESIKQREIQKMLWD